MSLSARNLILIQNKVFDDERYKTYIELSLQYIPEKIQQKIKYEYQFQETLEIPEDLDEMID